MDNLIIIGLSKTALHVYDFVKYHKLYNVIGFAVSKEYKKCDTFCEKPVYELEHLNEQLVDVDFSVFVAILWNNLNKDRKILYNKCKAFGYKMVNIISPTSIIRGEIVGDNCWIHDYVIVQNNSIVHSNVAIMAYTLIGANTIVESHCFFGARSLLGGGGSIGEQSFVGINATILDDTHVGKKCIIGACSIVKRNMPNFSKYSTSLDSFNFKQYNEDEIESKLIFSKNIR